MSLKKTALAIAKVLVITPLLFYIWRLALRPLRNDSQQTLAPGVHYQRKVYSQPRPYIVHTVEIDLVKSQAKPLVTPAGVNGESSLHQAMLTSSFVRKFNLELGINGSFFYPFYAKAPWEFYPREEDDVNALGASVANGQSYGKEQSKWNVVCFDNFHRVQIPLLSKCPQDTAQGIAGFQILVRDGRSTLKDKETPSYPRTAIGTNLQGDKLWLIVVDGKQPFYSEGVTLSELAKIAVNLGCDRALNLDGGGSTTLVAKRKNRVQVLNAPIHTRIPMRERFVANHLGFDLNPERNTLNRD